VSISDHDYKYWDKVWGKSNQFGSYSHLESRMERALDKIGFFIQNGISFKSGEKVLEAGCGDGLILLGLMRLVKVEGYGIDFSEVALKQAQNLMKLEKNNFDFK
jgi:cyclopropane fatty-acyl-phospholipid synthase-like methyltransferase